MSRRVLILEDFQNKDGLIIGEGFVPTADDAARLQKAGRFKGIASVKCLQNRAESDGQLASFDSDFLGLMGILMATAINPDLGLGHMPGNGYGHDVIDLDKLA